MVIENVNVACIKSLIVSDLFLQEGLFKRLMRILSTVKPVQSQGKIPGRSRKRIQFEGSDSHSN